METIVPRGREGSFEPRIVKKRQKRLTGVDEMVISLAAKGPTTGEVQAHLAEVYGPDVSRQTISAVTDKVLKGVRRRLRPEVSGERAALGERVGGVHPVPPL